MQIPTKKLKNGFEIPVLGIGTWKIGGTITRNENNDDQRDIQAIKYSISKGLTCIDSAEMYAEGYSESLLGKAIQDTPRNTLFISSKVRGDNCSYSAIKNACKSSLLRLGINYLDLYYIHWRDSSFSLKECMKAMNELVDEGIIRYIGVSNFSVETLKEAQSYSKHPIVANQVHFNLIYREPEHSGLLEYCQNNDVMLVAWRPLEYGNFSSPQAKDILDIYSKKYQKTYFQVALNWIVSHPNVVTLFMSRNPKNIDENLGSLGWEMDKNDREELGKSFPGQQTISNAVPLA